MTKYLKSKRGDIETEEYWRQWCSDFYKSIEDYHSNKMRDRGKNIGMKPTDYWERTVRVLGLVPCRRNG
jgi:hypothetical protein